MGWSVVLTRVGARKINVIKVVREVSGMSLKESKECTDRVPSTVWTGASQQTALDVVERLESAGARAEARAGEVEVAEPTGRGAVSVRLLRLGQRKISVIKAVREGTGLGLREAKELVESAPVLVASGLGEERALELLLALTDAGASAEIA